MELTDTHRLGVHLINVSKKYRVSEKRRQNHVLYMVGKSNFEFSYLLLLFTKLFYLSSRQIHFPCGWLPAIEGASPILPTLKRVSCYTQTRAS